MWHTHRSETKQLWATVSFKGLRTMFSRDIWWLSMFSRRKATRTSSSPCIEITIRKLHKSNDRPIFSMPSDVSKNSKVCYWRKPLWPWESDTLQSIKRFQIKMPTQCQQTVLNLMVCCCNDVKTTLYKTQNFVPKLWRNYVPGQPHKWHHNKPVTHTS